MRILDRYILKSTVKLFFGCLFVFLFLYVIIDAFTHLDEIIKNRTGLQLLGQYYLSFFPMIFVQISPVACLLATLYTFGKLNRNNEIIAMRASGLSIFQITKTIIIFGILVSLFVFLVNDKIAPQSSARTEKIKAMMESGRSKKQDIINNLSLYGLRNRLFFIKKFDPATTTIEGITILEHDSQQNIIRKLVANKGLYKDGFWTFMKSITYNFDENGQIKGEPQYLEEEMMIIPETPLDFLTQRQRPDFMTIAELEDYIWKLSKSGAKTAIRNIQVDLYQKYTLPLTSAIIILLGIPFALSMRKRATGMASIGLSLMGGFLYYVLSAVGIALGKSGIVSPLFATSLSHLLVLTTSLYLISKLP